MDNDYEFQNRVSNSGYASNEANWNYYLNQIHAARQRIRECENELRSLGYQGLT